MAQNLKDRLKRIQGTKVQRGSVSAADDLPDKLKPICPDFVWPGWTEAGFKTYKRELKQELMIPAAFPQSLAILIGDLQRMGYIPEPTDLLFFDLETTGLSGGAGTLAFLAAFGRFIHGELHITQYLLLDYPGESDFIELAVKEFDSSADGNKPVMVTYNGKTFDSQILKTRCLMNGISVPDNHHVDLLHPGRRLWKRMLPDCSQVTIEVSALSLDRTGDIPGAMAPDIWFSFLKTGDNRELLGICDHNVKDIYGLAALFLAFNEIALEPFAQGKKYRIDEEALALAWFNTFKKNNHSFFLEESFRAYSETGERLLKTAAQRECTRAVFTLGMEYFKKGQGEEGRSLMLLLAENDDIPGSLKSAVFRSLAIDAEWRIRDISLALGYTGSALAVQEISGSQRDELLKRQSRLEEKKNNENACN